MHFYKSMSGSGSKCGSLGAESPAAGGQRGSGAEPQGAAAILQPFLLKNSHF